MKLHSNIYIHVYIFKQFDDMLQQKKNNELCRMCRKKLSVAGRKRFSQECITHCGRFVFI